MQKAYELGMHQLCSFFNIVQKKGGGGVKPMLKKLQMGSSPWLVLTLQTKLVN